MFPILAGAALGTLIALPAVLAAIMPGGAGHCSYVAARLLFPVPMLLTLVKGGIGIVSGGIALLQFPLSGALLGWSFWRKSYGAATAAVSLHLVAAIACFAGILPDFS